MLIIVTDEWSIDDMLWPVGLPHINLLLKSRETEARGFNYTPAKRKKKKTKFHIFHVILLLGFYLSHSGSSFDLKRKLRWKKNNTFFLHICSHL